MDNLKNPNINNSSSFLKNTNHGNGLELTDQERHMESKLYIKLKKHFLRSQLLYQLTETNCSIPEKLQLIESPLHQDLFSNETISSSLYKTFNLSKGGLYDDFSLY